MNCILLRHLCLDCCIISAYKPLNSILSVLPLLPSKNKTLDGLVFEYLKIVFDLIVSKLCVLVANVPLMVEVDHTSQIDLLQSSDGKICFGWASTL